MLLARQAPFRSQSLLSMHRGFRDAKSQAHQPVSELGVASDPAEVFPKLQWLVAYATSVRDSNTLSRATNVGHFGWFDVTTSWAEVAQNAKTGRDIHHDQPQRSVRTDELVTRGSRRASHCMLLRSKSPRTRPAQLLHLRPGPAWRRDSTHSNRCRDLGIWYWL